MKLSQVGFNWETFGARDPLAAILTEGPATRAAWETEAFFRTGLEEWTRIRARCAELGLGASGARALDFGCGVGRVSRHLLADYEQVDAVDIAESMLRRARELDTGGRIHFLHNAQPHLKLVPDRDYDLVLSLITLQHLPPPYARTFIGELLRKLRPDGTLFFQLPARSHPGSARLVEAGSLKQRLRSLLPPVFLERYRLFRTGRPRMDMFGLPRDEVEHLIGASGGRLVAADEHDDTGGLLPSFRYYVTSG